VTGATAVTRFLVEILIAKSITPTVLVDGDGTWPDWLVARGAAVARDADGVRAAIAAHGLGARPWRLLATGELARAAALAGPRATLAALADGSPLDAGPLLAREVTLVGVAGPHPDLIVEAAAMCVKGE